jgi:predicted alpha/beta superfamily hydrolase
MKKILFIAWILSVTFISGQVKTNEPSKDNILSIDQLKTEPINVNMGYSVEFHSVSLNEDRTIMISLPEGYNSSSKKYPVFYLVDGQWFFNHATQTVGWLSSKDNAVIPQTIVVGIPTKENRERDLTPTRTDENKTGGGADKLYSFIKEELIPFIDKNYRTYNFRILGGASLGGVFALYSMMNDPQLFNAYLAFSPSMWWDNRIMLKRAEDFIQNNPGLHNHLYLNVANEGPSMGVDALAKILKEKAPKELIWKFDECPDEIHNTIAFKGIYNGLKFALSDWHYPLIDFGIKGDLSLQDTVNKRISNIKSVNLSGEILESYSGLYLDIYGRLLKIEVENNVLQFSSKGLPTVELYPQAENKFFLKGFDLQYEFVKTDSLVLLSGGKIECTAKKLKHPPLVKLSDELLERYKGTYTRSENDNGFDVIKEGNSLKVIAGTALISYLYPIGENRFFAYANGAGVQIEFIKDELNKIIKANIYSEGKLLMEAKKIK